MIVGILYAFAAASGFALFQLTNRRALHGVDVYRGTLQLLVAGTTTLTLIALVTGSFSALAAASGRSVLMAAIAGFVHFFLGWTLLGAGQTRIGVARTSALLGTMPLWGALVATLFLGQAFTARHLGGLVFVIAGVAVVVLNRPVGGIRPPGSVTGVASGLGTALCWGSSPVFVFGALETIDSPLMVALIGMAASTVVYGALVAVAPGRARRAAVSRRTWALAALAGTFVATGIWMMWTAFEHTPVAVVLAILQFTPPMVALAARWFARDEASGSLVRLWIGIAGIVGGSWILVTAT